MFSLDSLLDILEKHRQRATYGAAAAWLGKAQQSLMQGRPMTPRNSWIVSKATGLPTGYPDSAMHKELLSNANVIESEDELAEWLASLGSGSAGA